MDASIWVAILGIVAAMLTGIVTLLGIKLKASYDRYATLRTELQNSKRQLYEEYVEFICKIYVMDGVSHMSEDELGNLQNDFKHYHARLITFASNDVVKNLGDFMDHMYKYDPNDEAWNIKSMEYFGDLMVAVREDIGHHVRGQTVRWHDMTRPFVSDVDRYVPVSEHAPRANHHGPLPDTSAALPPE